MMKRTSVIVGLVGVIGVILFFSGVVLKKEKSDGMASVFQPSKTYVVGFLNYNPLLNATFFEFKKTLNQLGKEGGFALEYREFVATLNNKEGLVRVIDKLSKEDPDIVITGQTAIPLIEKKLRDTPLISMTTANTAAAELAMSSPDNHTIFVDSGASAFTADRLHFAHLLMPNMKKVVALHGKNDLVLDDPEMMEALRASAAREHITLVERSFTTRGELNRFFLTYDWSDVDAIFRCPDAFITANLDVLFAMSRQPNINKPLLVRNKTELEMGGLMAYGTNVESFGREAANIAVKILTKKSTPSDFLIQRPFKPELGVHRDVAEAFGITIPQAFLEQTDYIVE